jgi:hypothetical protein
VYLDNAAIIQMLCETDLTHFNCRRETVKSEAGSTKLKGFTPAKPVNSSRHTLKFYKIDPRDPQQQGKTREV